MDFRGLMLVTVCDEFDAAVMQTIWFLKDLRDRTDHVLQVKSSASEGLIRQCMQDMFEWNSGKVFLVSHTPNPIFFQRKVAQEMAAADVPMSVLRSSGIPKRFRKVLTSGRIDWLIEKVG